MNKILISDNKFSDSLRKIIKPPKYLYYEGNIELLKTNAIAVIGSRKCSEYGRKMTKKFTKELVEYGLTIVSGMAIGIDSIAHLTALEYGGNTIAVLPSGLNNIYPENNLKLFQNIIKNRGLVVSEYNAEEKADSYKFLERNRIVSGLAIGTLVIEGGYRSGTSVTARITKQNNKKVFCIPSSLENSKGFVPNELIKQGELLVTNVEDIIKEYPDLNLQKQEEKNVEIEKNIPDECRKIYEIIKDKPIYIDEIIRKSSIKINEVNYQLMILELQGYIKSLPGKNYIRRRD